MDELLGYYFQRGFSYKNYVVFIKVPQHRNVYAKSSAMIA